MARAISDEQLAEITQFLRDRFGFTAGDLEQVGMRLAESSRAAADREFAERMLEEHGETLRRLGS